MSLPDLKPFRSVWGLISSNSAATSANYDTINIFTQKKCAQTFIRMTVCVGVFGSEMQQLFFFFFCLTEQLMYFACNSCLFVII